MARRSAYGSITRLSPNVYRVRWWGDAKDGAGYRRLSHTIRGSRREASEFLAERQLDEDNGGPTMTVGEAYEKWYLPDITEHLAPNSIKMYRSSWNKTIAPAFADRLVTDIHPVEVQEWLDGLTKGQAETAMKVLRPLFRFPEMYRVISDNPMNVKYKMPKDVRDIDKGIYTFDELRRILNASSGSPIECAFAASAFGSARTGEALGIKTDDVEVVDTKSGIQMACIDICRQVSTDGSVSENLKTSQSRRFLVIPVQFAGAIAEGAQDGPEGAFLTGLAGYEAMPQKVLRKHWKHLVDDSGVQFHPYRNLRNSWRTFMRWDVGLNEAKVERLMGHAGNTVTDLYYDRPSKLMLAESVAGAFLKSGLLG